jgi:hypothetical protein
MDITEEYEILAQILATMRDRIAHGDARARIIGGVIEQMMAEREEEIADRLDPARREDHHYPL